MQCDQQSYRATVRICQPLHRTQRDVPCFSLELSKDVPHRSAGIAAASAVHIEAAAAAVASEGHSRLRLLGLLMVEGKLLHVEPDELLQVEPGTLGSTELMDGAMAVLQA